MQIKQLTFTRFIAATGVVSFHFSKTSILFNNKYFGFIFENSFLGVNYFFVLSGFVMVIAYQYFQKIPFRTFIVNRLARIYPLYFIAMAGMIALWGIDNKEEVWLSCLMMQSWVSGMALKINGPAWSLSVELFFYLCFPLVFNKIYKRYPLRNIIFGGLIFFGIAQTLSNCENLIPYYTSKDLMFLPIIHLNKFILGNITGLIFLSVYKNTRQNFSLYILGLLVILLLMMKMHTSLFLTTGIFSLLFALLILFISLDKSSISEFFQKPFFILLGEISFGIYILQVPVWQILSDARLSKYLNLDKQENSTSIFFIKLTVLILTSAILYKYIEKPCQSMIKSFFTKKGVPEKMAAH